MVKKNKNVEVKDVVADKTPAATDVPAPEQVETVTAPTKEKAVEDKELVLKADMPDLTRYTEVVLMNHSQNFICLSTGVKSTTLAPREIKKVSKDLLDELLKNPMVRRFFDKGVVSHNADKASNVVQAHDATAPDHLMEAVEKHEGGSNIVAEVKKFEKDGSFKIDLE